MLTQLLEGTFFVGVKCLKSLVSPGQVLQEGGHDVVVQILYPWMFPLGPSGGTLPLELFPPAQPLLARAAGCPHWTKIEQ